MAILRCKMCGGQLEVSGQESVVTCDYCGSRQTLPTLDHEKKQNLFNRANRLRMANEFDKASGVFESIVAEFPEEAEAYWGLVLCSYGIEYVDDPLTKTKIPTCHRTSYESIFNDVNYDLALEYADREAMLLYRKEAKEIDRIQKDILRIAASEEPFDVFICYKETDEQGQRTKDSVLAQDMYERLTEKGFKVFFSRITLEDKLGHEYEPYIFSALNSAKVMLVVGTDYEYFQSVWVKNEWSRYLELTKKDKNKLLIPCYADIDAYDLPVEFRNLQGQDMNKIGFMQDLIRGIGKVVQPEETVVETKEKKETVQTGMSPLLKRAFIFLEDCEWSDADAYCERVLDEDPENGYAYLGKLLSKLHITSINELIQYQYPLDQESHYQKILRFGDEELIQQVKRMNQKIIDRLEEEKCRELYEKAIKSFERATTEKEYLDTIKSFDEIIKYRDSRDYIEQCHSKIKDIQNGQLYKNAESKIDGTILGYENAIEAFRQIEHWNDVDERIHFCLNKIEEIRQKQIEEQKEKERQEALRKAEQERLEKQRQAEILRQEALRREKEAEQARIAEQKRIEQALLAEENRKKKEALEEQKRLEKEKQEELKRQKEAQMLEAKRLKEEKRLAAEQARIRRQAEKAVSENKKKPLMLILCFVLLIAGGLGTYFILLPSINYKKAQELLANQQYDEAYELFVSLGDYKDSNQILKDYNLYTMYDKAMDYYVEVSNASYAEFDYAEIEEAKILFTRLGDFKDAQIHLDEFEQLILMKQYEYAEKLYEKNILASDDCINLTECSEAIKLFEQIVDYENSKRYVDELADLIKNKLYLTSIGDIITFGSYEQDANLDNGTEAIEWLVLEIKDGKALVISKYALDNKPYSTSYTGDTWETCTLRKWLNNDFFIQAFNELEKNQILTTRVEPDENSSYDTKQGNATQDKVFLLSIQEVIQYFKDNDERCCKLSKFVTNNVNCNWWLRSTGRSQNICAYYVGNDGSVGQFVYDDDRGVRPAMWISVEEKEVANEPVSIEDASVGDTVLFGTYEQDNDFSNGKEEIEWIVLDKMDNQLMVMSRYGLDTQEFYDYDTDQQWDSPIWAETTLRRWLNTDFLNNAFTNKEKSMILKVNNVTEDNVKYGTSGGKDSQNQIFILSEAEFNNYLHDDSLKLCSATAYALKNGAYKGDNAYTLWWLRNTGEGLETSMFVTSDGKVEQRGVNHRSEYITVRPAMWIKISE